MIQLSPIQQLFAQISRKYSSWRRSSRKLNDKMWTLPWCYDAILFNLIPSLMLRNICSFVGRLKPYTFSIDPVQLHLQSSLNNCRLYCPLVNFFRMNSSEPKRWSIFLVSPENHHDPITLPHKEPISVGRTQEMRIVDPRCSRKQSKQNKDILESPVSMPLSNQQAVVHI